MEDSSSFLMLDDHSGNLLSPYKSISYNLMQFLLHMWNDIGVGSQPVMNTIITTV